MQPGSTQTTTRTRRHGPPGAAAFALFHAWRLLITRAWRGCVRGLRIVARNVSRWSEQWRRIYAYHSGTLRARSTGPDETRSTAAAFGLRTFIAGLAIAAGVAAAGGDPMPGVLIGILVECLWATARLTILVLLVPEEELERESVFVVYTAALIPYALALTPSLRLGALAVSGILTARGLLASGVSKATVRRAAGWAYGGQAAALGLGAVGRALLALLTAA